jgi:hypothetical protein
MAPEALTRRLTAAVFACCCIAACGRSAGDVAATWTVEPSPAVVGSTAVVRVSLRNEQQQPLQGARLQLEAHMTHPGMAPVTAAMIERHAGTYEAQVQLTMAGAWVIVMAGELADGARVTKNTEVDAVERARPPSSSPGT